MTTNVWVDQVWNKIIDFQILICCWQEFALKKMFYCESLILPPSDFCFLSRHGTTTSWNGTQWNMEEWRPCTCPARGFGFQILFFTTSMKTQILFFRISMKIQILFFRLSMKIQIVFFTRSMKIQILFFTTSMKIQILFFTTSMKMTRCTTR